MASRVAALTAPIYSTFFFYFFFFFTPIPINLYHGKHAAALPKPPLLPFASALLFYGWLFVCLYIHLLPLLKNLGLGGWLVGWKGRRWWQESSSMGRRNGTERVRL